MEATISGRVLEYARKLDNALTDINIDDYLKHEAREEYREVLALARMIVDGWVTRITADAEVKLAETLLTIRRLIALTNDPYGHNIGLGEAMLGVADDMRNYERAWYQVSGALYSRFTTGDGYHEGRRAYARFLIVACEPADIAEWVTRYVELEKLINR